MQKYRKILIFSIAGVGDSILFSPALQLLLKSFPDTEFHVLVMNRSAADYYRRFKGIERIHSWDFMNKPKLKSIGFILKLRKERFDLVVNTYPSNRAEYNIVAKMLGPKQIGHKYLRFNTFNFYFLNNILVREGLKDHAAEENIKLVRALGAAGTAEKKLLFPLDPTEIAAADEWVHKHQLAGTPVAGIHPGCNTFKNHGNRRWAPEKYGALSRALFEKHQLRTIVFGGPDEAELADTVCTSAGGAAVPVTGVKFGVAAALIQKCRLFVSNDSGLMHTAAAMQTPGVAIFGPTNPDFVHPYGSRHCIASLNPECGPCFFYSPVSLKCIKKTFECIRDMRVEYVMECCEKMLRG